MTEQSQEGENKATQGTLVYGKYLKVSDSNVTGGGGGVYGKYVKVSDSDVTGGGGSMVNTSW